MCDSNAPKSMDSGWGRKPYWADGMASATSTDNLPRAPKCLAYSPAALVGAAGTAAKSGRGSRTARTRAARESIRPPGELDGAAWAPHHWMDDPLDGRSSAPLR